MRPPNQFDPGPRLPSRPSRKLDNGLDLAQKNHHENAISGGHVASFTLYRYGTRVPDLHPLTGVNRLRLLLPTVGSPCNFRNHSTPSQGPGSHQVPDSLCLRLSVYSFRSSSLCYSVDREDTRIHTPGQIVNRQNEFARLSGRACHQCQIAVPRAAKVGRRAG